MIRAATHDDLPRLLELGALMHAEAPNFRGYPFQPERAEQTLRLMLDSPSGCALVAERRGEIVGGIVAIFAKHWACEMVEASDLALFIAPEHRGGMVAAGLVKAYREWAARHGVHEAGIGVRTGVHPERTGQLLQALGAEQTATLWTWRMPCA